MKSANEQALVAVAFRKLIAETRIEKAMNGDRSVAALARHFLALPWDTKVFTITDPQRGQWAVDVEKDGPTLTLGSTDPSVDDRIEVAAADFWKHLVENFEEAHPGLHLSHDESLLERLFHDSVSEHPEEMIRRREDDVLRAHRIQIREAVRRREEEWRTERAADHETQYAIWYQ